MTASPERTVRDIALENPASLRVFESIGIDYCCGGKKSLAAACEQIQVPVDRVLSLLASSGEPAGDAGAWNHAPLSQLTRHIVDRHHGYVRQETPRIDSLLSKVISRHGTTQPHLSRLRDVFAALAQELTAHMFKEEQVLFPYIEQMEAAAQQKRRIPRAGFGSVKRPVAMMTAEHDLAGQFLAQLRELTNGYELPAGACLTFSGMYQALAEFERDLHLHIHLENNILFPRAIEMEQAG
jgi:regulator of cell morphogenesis and NO signaling